MSKRVKDYYAILKVARNATQADIKKAYVALAKQYHPDLLDEQDPKYAFKEDMFKQITEAYSTLNNPRKRSLYNFETQVEGENVTINDVMQDRSATDFSMDEKVILKAQYKKYRFRKIRRLFIIVAALFVFGWFFKLKYIFLRMYSRDVSNKVIFKDKEGIDKEMMDEVNRKFSQELERVRAEREKMNILKQPTKKTVKPKNIEHNL